MSTLPVSTAENNAPLLFPVAILPAPGMVPTHAEPIIPVVPRPIGAPSANVVDFADPGATQNSLAQIVQPGEIFEIRLLDCRPPAGNGRPFPASGYFDNVGLAAQAIALAESSMCPAGIYMTVNRCNPGLLARSPNAIEKYPKSTTSDGDITRRCRLMIDVDPERPSGISANDQEKQAAFEMVGNIRDFLEKEHGFFEPVVQDSGNGTHLLYPIDLPNDQDSKKLIEKILGVLHAKFSSAIAKVDKAVGKAAQLTKVPGTMARKGAHTADRPHRRARIISAPSVPGGPVAIEKLQAVAALEVPGDNRGSNAEKKASGPRLRIEDYLKAKGIEHRKPDQAKHGWTNYPLEKCPFHDHSTDGGNSTVVMQNEEGALGFRCLHGKCADFRWKDFVNMVGKPDDDHWDRPASSIEGMATTPMFYDHTGKNYWEQANAGGRWISLNENSAKRHLAEQGLAIRRGKFENLSEVDQMLIRIQREHAVDFSGPLAGWKAGHYRIGDLSVLVTESPRLVEPVEGDCTVIQDLLKRSLGEEQYFYLCGWLKCGYQTLRDGGRRPGQALALAGPRDSFKSFTQNHIITALLGGRSAKPYQFMSGQTAFNSDLFGAEHLMLEDEVASTDIKARRHFGSTIKDLTVNEVQRHHGKHRTAIYLNPFWRLTISVNDEPENLMVLPPLDESLKDKLMIFKVSKIEPPMPTNTLEERAAFRKVISDALPAFADFLLKLEIPEELRSQRFGIREYHHPGLLTAVDELAPEARLLSFIDGTVFNVPGIGSQVEYTAIALEHKLTAFDAPFSREAMKLFSFPNACGTYLARLALKVPDRVKKRRSADNRTWILYPPKHEVTG